MHQALPRAATTKRLPPVLDIIALATFSASLSARALDPVLPHVADDFRASASRAAASFAAVFRLSPSPVISAGHWCCGPICSAKARFDDRLAWCCSGLPNILRRDLDLISDVCLQTRIISPASARAGYFPVATRSDQ